MANLQLRQKIHDYVDQADDQLLEIVLMLFKREYGKGYYIAEEDWVEIEKRQQEMSSGKVKGIPSKKALGSIRKKLKSKNG